MPAIPFYEDWTFWAMVISAIAVILSQLPPVLHWFKSAKLDLELYSEVALTHKLGNPNVQAHLLIANIGGRSVRIKSIEMKIEREGQLVAVLPAKNYLHNPSDKDTRLLTSFKLNPNDEWAHIVNFLNFFGRDDQTGFDNVKEGMLKELNEAKKTLKKEEQELYRHSDQLVQQAQAFFDRMFIWRHGEYVMSVVVTTENAATDLTKKYRFTMFESQESVMRQLSERLVFGEGIYWETSVSQRQLLMPISEN